MDTLVERLPFHDSIVETINIASEADLPCLAALIKRTKIPANHDKIIEAWEKRVKYFGLKDDYGVVESVASQSPEQFRLVMRSAKSLREALELGVDCIPLGSDVVGPQGLIALYRNKRPKARFAAAEILVFPKDGADHGGMIIFLASWSQGDTTFVLESPTGENIEDWNDKW